MNYKKYILITLFACNLTTSAFASSVAGGEMVFNLNNTAFASAFSHDDSNRPSIYLEEYFNAAQAASRSPEELLTDHIVPGAGEVSATGLQLVVNSPVTSGFNIASDFTFDSNDLVGSATGNIGLGGAMRFRLDVPFNINPVTGEEEGNRTMTGYYSLEYDASRINGVAGHSGWAIFNHHTFRAEIFDLDNVVSQITANSLELSGDIALGSGFNHLGGQQGTIIGDFDFQTSVVPVPAAVWFFISGLTGLFITKRTSNKVAA